MPLSKNVIDRKTLADERFIAIYGIIIKKSDFGEGNSLITLIDKEKGKLEFASFHSNKAKSTRRSSLLVSNLVGGILYRSSEEKLLSLKEIFTEKTFIEIRSNLNKVSYFYLIFEVLNQLLIKENPFPFFSLFLNTLDEIEIKEDFEKYAFFFILSVLKNEGIMPYHLYDRHNDDEEKIRENIIQDISKVNFKLGSGTARFIKDVQNQGSPDFLSLKKLSPSVISNLLEYISGIIRYYTGSELASLSLMKKK